jgi:hypothetical protein
VEARGLTEKRTEGKRRRVSQADYLDYCTNPGYLLPAYESGLLAARVAGRLLAGVGGAPERAGLGPKPRPVLGRPAVGERARQRSGDLSGPVPHADGVGAPDWESDM